MHENSSSQPAAVPVLRERVAAGEPMVILSAMKMETTVAAPGPGRVDSISVKSGDDVEAGDVLITLG